MPDPDYRVSLDVEHRPFAVILDQPSYSAPFLIRITWRPSAAQAGLLVPDWIHGQPAYDHRIYRDNLTSRWYVRPSTYGFRDVTLETVKEGVRSVLAQIPPPKTRTRGRWFSWESGAWKDMPNHDWHQPCYARTRAEYWHTPQWEPGADMRPMPPTDEAHAAQKVPK